MRSRLAILALALALAAMAFAPALGAQTVRGNLIQSGTDEPIAQAFVILLDVTGRIVGTTLTSTRGEFVIPAPASGAYKLRTDRIGYASAHSPEFELQRGQVFEYQMRVAIEPVELSSLDVRRGARCELLPDEGRQIYTVWEEARKAMAASVWTGMQQYYRFDAVHFVNDLDRAGRRRNEVSVEEVRYYGRHPFKSIGSRDLALGGFVQSVPGRVAYYGPDADVMMSEDFLARHCFRLAAGSGEHAGSIGLEFEPVGERRLSDIAGVIWLDRSTAALQHLEYEYRNLRLPVSTKRLGGRVEFKRLPSGAWIVQRWYIRVPIIEFSEVRVAGGGREVRPVLQGIDEGGGAVTAVYATSRLFESDPADSLGVSPPPDSLIARYPFEP
ncbi:MAG: carboxypeptidase-like regulatory domain-containing protein [Gemmatimonadota bacterium]